tara:strand:- start:1669 stop:3813 length:2145 start_codon:yes stop_codon:yes gene_type:complete
MPNVASAATLYIAGAFANFVAPSTAVFLASTTVSLATSLLLSAASNALTSNASTKQQDQSRDLSSPTTAPEVRYVYGHTRAAGTPTGTPVKGEYIYGNWILNSRWSDLTGLKLFLDKREVEFTGDPYDFSGVGAIATNGPFLDHTTFWISKGDETTPPDVFTSENGYHVSTSPGGWKTTDAWRGLTTIWVKIKAGDQEERAERWPSAPPFLEVEANWSRVYDPRDVAQDFSDETTWTHSSNLALCVLDSLKENPVRPYQQSNLDLVSFSTAADIADLDIALNAGGTEKEFVIAGTLVFSNGELEDQVMPLVSAGGGYLVRSGGQVGLQLPKYQTPSQTHTDFLGSSLTASDLLPTTDIVNNIRTVYTSIVRGYESAELKPYDIPGALSVDGNIAATMNLNLNFCPSATQAMRVRKIVGGLIRRQKSLQVILEPKALDLLPGSTITLDLPAPFNHFDGLWEVQSVHPGLDMYGTNDSVAMMVPVNLIKHSSTIYDWDPATDEEVVTEVTYVPASRSTTVPGTITTQVNYVNTGSVVQPIIKFLFDPSPSSGVVEYEWQYTTNTNYVTGGKIDKDTRDSVETGKVYGQTGASETLDYTFRVRTLSGLGASAWVYSSVVNVDVAFSSVVAAGESGLVRFTGTTPTSPSFSYSRVYENTVDDFSTATQLGSDNTSYGSNQAFDITKTHATGTDFYWIVPYTTTNLEGTVSGSYELTVT